MPRKTAVALFRMEMGHDCLSEHLCKINCLSTPTCSWCDEDAIMGRHLGECKSLTNRSQGENDADQLIPSAIGLLLLLLVLVLLERCSSVGSTSLITCLRFDNYITVKVYVTYSLFFYSNGIHPRRSNCKENLLQRAPWSFMRFNSS